MVTVLPAGAEGLLVECADSSEATAMYQHLQRERAVGNLDARDVIPGARSVLLDGVDDRDGLAQIARAWRPVPEDEPEPRHVTIPVVYDGPDLELVAQDLNVSVAKLIELHRNTVFTAAFAGFMPGFAYLEGFPHSVARHGEPRTHVPAGAVGLAAQYCGVYPRATPGGWKLIATMTRPETLWNENREPTALITPGTTVQFEEAV
ncbi:5-oxoprolinase subunit B family protein [Haloglycomyces albus]|uniref:5-oxoprolinase subunit B family protein n=1 Tax=Haloglycomyces albus TaxID=526067 RepID=UPI00046CBA8B|nr:carboxyltransferase domain-containing protein [Haloglycomyces albus]